MPEGEAPHTRIGGFDRGGNRAQIVAVDLDPGEQIRNALQWNIRDDGEQCLVSLLAIQRQKYTGSGYDFLLTSLEQCILWRGGERAQ